MILYVYIYMAYCLLPTPTLLSQLYGKLFPVFERLQFETLPSGGLQAFSLHLDQNSLSHTHICNHLQQKSQTADLTDQARAHAPIADAHKLSLVK